MLIVRNKFLAELDYIYSVLEPKLEISIGSEKPIISSYKIDKYNKNPLLFYNNFILNNIDKTTFIEKLDYVFELRMFNNHVFEVTYLTNESKNDGEFDFESFKPVGNDSKSFKLCYDAKNLSVIQNGKFLNGKTI